MSTKEKGKDLNACPKCDAFPCICPPPPPGDGTDDDNSNSDFDVSMAAKGSAVDNSLQASELFANELTQLFDLTCKPEPNAHVNDEFDQPESTQRNVLLSQNKQLPHCAFFALTQNQSTPAAGSKLQEDDSTNDASSMALGMSMGGAGE